ncbi:hypothetical protein BJ742DRAFT_769121 [Cladochytrium replicatum]|nr:hypothetical protein BJ742DRAFT_769121 [Cladochytrium replicatum]
MKERIERAQKSGVLTVQEARLKEFPSRLLDNPASATVLRNVDLGNNRIKEMYVPSTLQVVPLFDIRLLSPAEISKWQQLRVLSLAGNNIERLPDALFALVKLERLNISDDLGNLKQLKSLDFSHNSSLSALPDSIGGLKKLLELNLSHCQALKCLPEGLGGLGDVELIDLSGCTALIELPAGFSQMLSVKTVSLKGCTQFAKVPSDLLKYTTKLVLIDLTGTILGEEGLVGLRLEGYDEVRAEQNTV